MQGVACANQLILRIIVAAMADTVFPGVFCAAFKAAVAVAFCAYKLSRLGVAMLLSGILGGSFKALGNEISLFIVLIYKL